MKARLFSDALINNTRVFVKKQSVAVAKKIGIRLLTKEETIAYLKPYQIAKDSSQSVDREKITSPINPSKVVYNKDQVMTSQGYVWNYEPAGKKATLLRCGSVLSDSNVLFTDFGNFDLFKDVLKLKKRTTHQVDTLIAPWSRYWEGYYDYMLLVAAKICRIKDAVSPDLFQQAVISYPLFHTPFEQEFLELIGFKPEQIFDSRSHRFTFKRVLLGNNDKVFYPNIASILSLKNNLGSKLNIVSRERNRIYISRSERRRIVNESDLIKLLERYDFKIIEDKPRSLAEQADIYANASFIIGPHGASFTNILWCQPGTHLFELFTPSYVYDFFQYLARQLGLEYSAYYTGDVIHNSQLGIADNVYVSIPEVEECLNLLLADSKSPV